MLREILGQSNPAADTTSVLYDTPASSQGVRRVLLKSIYVTNIDFQNGDDRISVWIVPSGATIGDMHCILNKYTLSQAENILKVEMILEEGTHVRINSERGTSTFMAFGESDFYQDRIKALKDKVLAGTVTAAEKEEIMLLTGGAYVTQSQTQSCSP